MIRGRLLGVVVALLLAIAGGCAALAASATFDRAVEAFERGDYTGAISHLEESLRRGPDSARARILLGWSLLKTGNLSRAKTEFERALVLDPRDANAYYAHEGLGWIAYRSGDYDRALSAFAESLRLSPGYHNAHDGLGWAYLAKGDLIRAESNFKLALERAPGDLDARRGLGFVAYHRGDWAQAIEQLRGVLRDNEGDTLSRSALGWTYYRQADFGPARDIFQDLARREPTWADPVLGLAWIAERQGRGADAHAAFKIAIDRSAIYVATSDPAGSLRTLLGGRAEWLDLWRDLGWGLYHQRAFALADAEFASLLERHPNDPDGLRGHGYVLFMLRRYPEAIAILERSLATGAALPPVRERVEIPGVAGLHPIVSDATSTLAWSHYRAGNLPAALKLFRETTARHPDWADAWSGLGWTLKSGGDRAEAERAFRRSLAAEPGYPDAAKGLESLGKRPR